MADIAYIPEKRAVEILMNVGDYAESQARIILGHSRKQVLDGVTYYPLDYIERRASRQIFAG